jgi:Sulfotransferase domain
MKILLIGFQRSGTTLSRRLIELHPDIRRMFHEVFLLKRYQSKKALENYFSTINISMNKQTWGEKVPFYPSARKYPIIKYCQKWKEYFGKKGRIIHIVRHPYDVAFSVVSKYKKIEKIDQPIKLYRGIIPTAIPEIEDLGITKTIKYEDLLLNPQEVMHSVYEFCGVDPNFDFQKAMMKIANKKYQTIDKSRVFAYKNQKIKNSFELEDTITFLNTFGNTKYEL